MRHALPRPSCLVGVAILLVACGRGQPTPSISSPAPAASQSALADRDLARVKVRELEDKVGRLQAALDEANRLLAASQAAKAKGEAEQKRLESQVAEMSREREALPAAPAGKATGAGSSTSASKKVKGLVLAASPADDIYLVSVGQQDGVRVGDELTVFRGDTFVAVVVVDRVMSDKASVVVKQVNGKPFQKSDIQRGDRFATID